MKKRINRFFLLISILSILITAFLMIFAFYEILKRQVFDELKRYALLIMDSPETAESVIQKDSDNLRVTIITEDGTVIFDSASLSGDLENHFNRPEIQSARKSGEARIVRQSDTLSLSLFYYAQKLSDGKIIRVGKKSRNAVAIFSSSFPFLLITVFVLITLSFFLSNFLTKKIIGPVEKMADNIDEINFKPEYTELVPFVNKIRSQHDTILASVNVRQEFTANVSHELKTPLTAISGYAELIEEGLAEQEQIQHFACEIHKSSSRLLQLINDILKLSELDSSNKILSNVTCDINSVLNNTAEMLGLEAKKKNVKLEFDCAGEVLVPLSKEYALELCFNLIENAIRYNKDGGSVKVSVKKVNQTGLEKSSVIFCVEDTGIGIPLESQERVFERFYRVNKGRSRQLGGTGLGLAIVKHIAQLSEAEILLESRLGLGTKISVVWDWIK